MNPIDTSSDAELLDAIDRWVQKSVIPNVKKYDHADEWPAEIVEEMKALGC